LQYETLLQNHLSRSNGASQNLSPKTNQNTLSNPTNHR
jgi:hypothetical protein